MLARADVAIAARYVEYFGNLAGTLTGEHIPRGGEVVDFTTREPYGVCAQINRWKFPLNMAARSVAAVLAAGNVAVLKTPALAPLTTAVLGRIVTAVGLPPGVVILRGSVRTAGPQRDRVESYIASALDEGARSRWAATGPTWHSTAVGSSNPPCSSTCLPRCASRARRSSARY
jgi:delta 1-pyrroline-5-carboxylate dehydrogenase